MRPSNEHCFIGVRVPEQRDARRMLKQFRHLTHPTPARQDAPFRRQAAGESKPEAYPLGRTVRRIRSTKSVRAAEC